MPSATKIVHSEVNLDENDEGELEEGLDNSEGSYDKVEEEGKPDEFFDVLDILDGRADQFNDDEPSVTLSRTNEILHISSDGEEEQEQDVDDEGGDHDMDAEGTNQLTPSDDEADVEALHTLGQYISNLDPSAKRKFSEGEGAAVAENVPHKKRKILKERNEAGAENEFAASGELEYDQHNILPRSDSSALQARPNSILRTFSLPL